MIKSNGPNNFKDAIETATDLLNKLKSATALATNSGEFKTAVETATELLHNINGASLADAPVVNAPDAPVLVDDAPDAPVLVDDALVDDALVDDAPALVVNCGVRASVLSSADPSCYIMPELPPLAQMIQAAFANEISTAGREIVMNFLKGAGIQGVESAILTPDTINQLDALSKDPAMKTKIQALQTKLDTVAEQAVIGIENKVEPQLEKIVGDVEAKAVGGLGNAIADIPLVGDVEALGQEMSAISEIGNQIPSLEKQVTDELKPLEDLKDEVSAVTDSIPKVPELDIPTIPTVPTVPTVTVKGGGSSRKRRRIHKLSRRIERTLRRVHGLHDKNSFLRRSLRRGHKNI